MFFFLVFFYNFIKIFAHITDRNQVKMGCCTCCYDDYRAEEANLGVGEPEAVDPLGQLEDAVHQELGVPGRHRRDRLPSYHITVQTDQALQ